MTQSTQRRIPSLRSIALCLFTASTSVSAAPHPKGGPFRALESVPSGVSLAQIITGLYANDTAEGRIVVQDIHGRESWSWSVADANNQKNIPADLLTCIKTHTAVPEAKWTNGGRSVISIYNAAAIMINHMPGSDQDKQIIWGTCLDRNNMRNTHSLELVPDGKIAIATTSASSDATIKIFNVTAGMQADAEPLQSLSLLPAVHSLVWDQYGSVLWGTGSTTDPAGTAASAPALNGYRYSHGSFSTNPTYAFNVTQAIPLKTEWTNTQYDGWWDGGHDMTGIPGRRQLLLSTDTDVHVFDIDSQNFQTGAPVASNYMRGFTPVDSRVGANGESLPRSDIKSLSIDGNYNMLYIQSAWQAVTSHQINILEGGKMQPELTFAQEVYRARWFADTPTWPKARLPPQ